MASGLLLSAVGDNEDAANTTAEVTIFSGIVPGGTLGTNTLLILRMISDILNSSGVPGTATIRVKFGGTTIHTFTTISLNSNLGRYADVTTVFLGAENATNAQRSMMDHKQGGNDSGAGGVSGGNDHNTSVNRLLAVDSTLDQTLEVTVQLPAAHADLRYRRRGVWVEHHAPGAGSGTDLVVLDTDALTYNNDAAEHSVCSLIIPGGTIETGNLAILRVYADVLNNTGSDQSWSTKGYLGGTQIYNGGSGVSNPSSTLRRAFTVEYWIGGAGATDAQRLAIIGHTLATSDGAGEGDLGTAGWQATNSTNDAALDSSTDLTFELRNVFSAASPDLEFRYHAALVAVIS